ncbi:TipAS antibiotic-recognition domain-containing protein [Thalassotalea psychrophila]|uniref:TipAS antibiotic-recognition domain-containing protein n=1 Tax=Thalassotalea psychrophila TaxID=3065647 RepID=A0ABY9TV45_9GAMM|nr:TipAS antibiotic-recognition domain-containing protein [Colwelliaceae bacterium SQ149]
MSDVNKDVNDEEFENAELERQEQLARDRVGDDKVDQRLEQLANLSIEDTMALKEKADAFNTQIAQATTFAIDSDEMQAVVQHYLAYTTFALSTLQKKSVLISKEKFNAMANSIANDADQKANFEQFSTGFSKTFSDAMLHYAQKNLK